jgi:hypothetical protein
VLQAVQNSHSKRKLAMDNFFWVTGNSKQPPDENTGNGQLLLCYRQLENCHPTRKLAMDKFLCVTGCWKQPFDEIQATEDFVCVAGNSEQPSDEKTCNGRR